jgi:diguanylate cyclase (GGDEF)-like protein
VNVRSLLLLREDVGESYDAVVRAAADAVGAETCHIALFDELNRELIARRPRYTAPREPRPQFRFPLESSPASARVVDTCQAYISNDPENDPLYHPSVVENRVRSILTAPILLEDQVLGLLYALNRPGGFSEEDARTLTALGSTIAVTLENLRLYTEERDRRILHESLSAVSRALVKSGNEETALQAMLDQLWRVVRCAAAVAVVVEGRDLRVVATRGGERGLRLPLVSCGDLARKLGNREPGEIGISPELIADLGLTGSYERAIAAPLVGDEEALGAIVVAFDSEHAAVDREGRLLAAFAEHTAFFMQAGRLAGRERQVMSRAAAVGRVTWMVSSRGDVDAIFELAASELRALAGVERATLYVHEPQGTLTPAADAGLSPEEREAIRGRAIDLAVPSLAPMLERRVPVVLHGKRALDVSPFRSVRAALLLPLVSHDAIIGVVTLTCDRHEHPFDAPLVDFLQDVAQQIAFGVENARLFSKLTELATTDELTGLANRRRFMELAEAELERAREGERSFALILADLDHLKRINDSHGHAAGDIAIVHAARALEQHLRSGDLAARVGGEEFAVALPERDALSAADTAERVRSDLSDAFVSGVGRVTASFGVAAAPEDGATVAELMKAADQRLYEAKAAGRNRVWSGAPVRSGESDA